MQLFLILHNIRSLHNVGSIFRTADGAGVKKIYLTGYTPSPYDFFSSPSAVSGGGKLRKDFAKTALGAEKFVEWEKVKNISKVISALKKDKFFMVSLEQAKRAVAYDKFTSIYRSKLKRYSGIALIVGNEVRGISPTILKKSDAIIEIPMHGKKESLNVSVATGVVLYEFGKLVRAK